MVRQLDWSAGRGLWILCIADSLASSSPPASFGMFYSHRNPSHSLHFYILNCSDEHLDLIMGSKIACVARGPPLFIRVQNMRTESALSVLWSRNPVLAHHSITSWICVSRSDLYPIQIPQLVALAGLRSKFCVVFHLSTQYNAAHVRFHSAIVMLMVRVVFPTTDVSSISSESALV